MKNYFILVGFLLFCNVFYGQPGKPTIIGPDSIWTNCSYLFHVLPLSNSDYILWDINPGSQMEFTQGNIGETIGIKTAADPKPKTWIIAHGHNSLGDGPNDTLWVTILDQLKLNKPTGDSMLCQGKQGYIFNVQPLTGITAGLSYNYVWSIDPSIGVSIVSGNGSSSIIVDVPQNTPLGKEDISVIDAGKYNNCPSKPGIKTISVEQVRDVAVTITQTSPDSSLMVCSGEPASFLAKPFQGGNNPTYQWKINGKIDINQSSSHFTTPILTNNTDHDSIVSIYCGLFSSDPCPKFSPAEFTLHLTINPHSRKGNLIPDTSAICQYSPDSVRIIGNTGGPTNWEVSYNNGTSYSPIKYTQLSRDSMVCRVNTDTLVNQLYRVTIKSGNCSSVQSDPIEVRVFQTPIGDIDSVWAVKAGNNFHAKDSIFLICAGCVRNDKDGLKNLYYWGFVDDHNKYNYTDTVSNKQFCQFKKDLTYKHYFVKVKLKSASEKCVQWIPYYLLAKDISINAELDLFPNPNNGIFTIILKSDLNGKTTIKVYDLVSKEQIRIELDKKEPIIQVPLNVTNLQKGIYLVEATFSNGERLIKKILIY